MKHYRLIWLTLLFLLGACTPPKSVGFGLPGSPIRYETTKFETPDQLAEINGLKITSAQILDSSPAIKDLDQQRNEALIAMTYLKAVEKTPDAKGVVEVALPLTDKKLEQLLARFDRKPTPGVGLAFTKSLGEGVVGKLSQTVVKRDDLDEYNGVLQIIEDRRYTEVASQLAHQLSRLLLNEEAMKSKTPLQDYIVAKVINKRGQEVSGDELKAHLKKIGFAESELTPELHDQFMTSLAQQKEQLAIEEYVAKNVIKGPVKVSFRPPQADIHLNGNWKPVAGYADAPITLVAFAALTCPECAPFVDVLNHATEKYNGYVKLIWINNFSSGDHVARTTAQAALCIDSIKPNQSFPFIKDFARKESTIDETAFYAWVKGHGVDEGKFKTCFVGQQQSELLEQHLKYAKQVGVVANQTLWVEGRMFAGTVSPEDLDHLIDQQILEKQVSPIGAFWRRLIERQ